jgi:hypothetical protein
VNLGPLGRVAPFFLKRVLGCELEFCESPTFWKQLIRKIASFPLSLVSRGTPVFAAYVELQLCESCTFIQTRVPFHEEDVMKLYADYRSQPYNQERIKYEPTYAAIAARVGQDSIEVKTRTSALTAFLKNALPVDQVRTILDYGGADGRFLPDIRGEKFVFDVSNIETIAGITRVKSESELTQYSLVLLAHVTEHLVYPLALVRKLSDYVEPGGFLYIETPQEITDQQRDDLRTGRRRIELGIHEHLNYYSIRALTGLIQAAGFSIVASKVEPVDIGWIKTIHLRILGQKPS